jgi:hypothetical protein
MKFPLFLSALVSLGLNASAQITTAENGLTVPASSNTVQLGGSLLQNTTIDLSGFGFHLKSGNTPLFTTLSNGNVGLGTTTPAARLSFPNIDASDDPVGITWYNETPTTYGIHRTAGPWTGPDYQQLRFASITGIILDPGTDYGKSYVDIQGNGLRVMQGRVGIGTRSPGNFLSIATSIANSSGLQFVNLSATSPAVTGNGKVLSVDNNGNVILVNDIGGTGTIWSLTGNGLTDPNTNFIGTTDTQPLVFRTNNLQRAQILANGNFLVNKTTDNGNALQVNGIISADGPNARLAIGINPSDDLTPYTQTIWDTYSARLYGNVSIFSSGTTTNYGDSYELDFYARYGNAGQGIVTNKAGYLKATAINDNNLYPPQSAGRGTLILGSTNTDYNNNQFVNVPAVYVSNGRVGIGVATPQSQLHTNGAVRFEGLTNDNTKDRVIASDANGNLYFRDAATLGGIAGWGLGGNSVTSATNLGTTSNQDLPIITNNTVRMRILGGTGNVIIGASNIVDAGYKLAVDGNIRSRKVHVDQDAWADFVFENNYPLRSIKELEQYIQQQKHLPGVPSAAEVKKEGIDLGDNQAVLLKKIEELTLYVIEQNKKIEALEKLVLQQQKDKETQNE